MAKRRHGLAKYDAPLPIQFEKGRGGFKRGILTPPYHPNTMQAREWLRGFNSAFTQHLKRITNGQISRRSNAVHA